MFLNKARLLSRLSISGLLLLGCSASALALESDKTAPIFIEANQVAMAEKTGVSTYTGNVKLEQGSIKIQADSIVVYTLNKKLQRIIATGKPALFSHQPSQKSQHVQASANHVEFTSSNGMLTLLDDAKMKQGANSFSGNKIEYDTVNNILNANASPKNQQRVKAVLQPETFREPSDNKK